MPGPGELESDPEPVQRRIAGADQPHAGQRPRTLPKFVSVFTGFERDVVAEPFRLLVRVGMTPDIDQQSGVVDRHPVLLVQPRVVREPQCDQALAQDMSMGWPNPRSTPSDSAATSSASRTRG